MQKIRSLSKIKVSDAREFQRIVLIPQLFIFVMLMVLGTILGQELLANISRLAAVAYLLIVNISVQTYLREISARILVYHVVSLVALVLLLALFLGQEPIIGAFLPAALVLLGLTLLRVRWDIAAWAALPVLTLLVCFSVPQILLRGASLTTMSHGLVLVILSALAVILKAGLVYRRSGKPSENFDLLPDPETVQSGALKVAPRGRAVETQIQEEAGIIMADEVRSDLLWRLPSMLVLYAALSCFILLSTVAVDLSLLCHILMLLALDAVVIQRLMRSGSVREFYTTALLATIAGLIWWGYLLTTTAAGGFVPELLLALFVVLFVSTPWSPMAAGSLGALCVVLAFLRFGYYHQPALVVVLMLACLVVALRNAMIGYHSIAARATLLYLRRCIDSGVSTLSAVRLLAERLLHLVGAERLLLVTGDQEAEIVTIRYGKQPASGEVYVRAIVERAKAQQSDEGILMVADLGPQFSGVLFDWLGIIPQRIIFVRFAAVIDERERDIMIFCPLTRWGVFIGLPRVFRSFLGLATVVRSSLAAARSRFQSSDVLLATQQLLSQREEEGGAMVHLVNNIAQDIAIQCDAIERGALGGAPKELQIIENLARNLSTGVSDQKLLRELARVREATRFEDVPIEPLLNELRAFGDYRRHRRGEEFTFTCEASSDLAVRVSSREFLETALRTLLRLASARLERGGKVHVVIAKRDEMIDFEISDTGAPLTEAALRQLTSDISVSEAEVNMRLEHAAIKNFVRNSGGRLTVSSGLSPYSTVISVAFPATQVPQTSQITTGHWALLVDDNPQVTSFYARVAEALSLPYGTAASLAEAKQLLLDRGRPRIVITDIQLGEGSGLELVRALRGEFGSEIPVIVVSGQTSDALGNQVEKVGATKFLTKPVGRARLFAEIRELLGL